MKEIIGWIIVYFLMGMLIMEYPIHRCKNNMAAIIGLLFWPIFTIIRFGRWISFIIQVFEESEEDSWWPYDD